MQSRPLPTEFPTFGWPAPTAPPVLFEPERMQLAFDPDGDAKSPWIFNGNHYFHNCVFHYFVADGSRTDLASVPRIARLWCNPNGRWQRAAAFHDAAYRKQNCSRYDADAMFRAIMLRDGVGALRAFWMYAAVRCFGWIAWRRNRIRNEAAA